jgi:hypothetical protein
MKDIHNKPSKPLDLSKPNEAAQSPYTLDLSPKRKSSPEPSDSRQTNFFEYMPATAAAANDDEFIEKVGDWFTARWSAIRIGFSKMTAVVAAAIAPLKLYWAVVIGAGLIIGLLIISYIATHRDWITSFPSNIFAVPTAGKGQGNDGSKNGSQPSKSVGGAALQSPSPEAAKAAQAEAAKAGSGGAGVVNGASAAGGVIPSTGGSTAGSGGAVAVPGGSAVQTVTKPVQQAPTIIRTPAPAPAPAPLPVKPPVATPAPAPLPLPAPAPILKSVDNVTSPVTDTKVTSPVTDKLL